MYNLIFYLPFKDFVTSGQIVYRQRPTVADWRRGVLVVRFSSHTESPWSTAAVSATDMLLSGALSMQSNLSELLLSFAASSMDNSCTTLSSNGEKYWKVDGPPPVLEMLPQNHDFFNSWLRKVTSLLFFL